MEMFLKGHFNFILRDGVFYHYIKSFWNIYFVFLDAVEK